MDHRPGAPVDDPVSYTHLDVYKRQDLGSSAAQSVVLMFIVIALTVVQFRYVDRLSLIHI